MNFIDTDIPDVKIIEPEVYRDNRGFFCESFHLRRFQAATECDLEFVQDNHSKSAIGVLRGLHYQIQQPQGKLVRVLQGSIFDVAVDLRLTSVYFGHWVGETLSRDNFRQLWVPPGFAHGFLVLENDTEVFYKTTDFYAPQHERRIDWDDPDLGIQWPPHGDQPSLSAKDQQGVPFHQAEYYP